MPNPSNINTPASVPSPSPPSPASQIQVDPPLSPEQLIRNQIGKLQQPTFVQKHPWAYLLFLMPGVASGYFRAYQQRQQMMGNLMDRLSQIQQQRRAMGIKATEDQNNKLYQQGRLGDEAVRNALTQQKDQAYANYLDALLKLKKSQAGPGRGFGLGGGRTPLQEMMMREAMRGYDTLVANASKYKAVMPDYQTPTFEEYLKNYPGLYNYYLQTMGIKAPQTVAPAAPASASSPPTSMTIPY